MVGESVDPVQAVGGIDVSCASSEAGLFESFGSEGDGIGVVGGEGERGVDEVEVAWGRFEDGLEVVDVGGGDGAEEPAFECLGWRG